VTAEEFEDAKSLWKFFYAHECFNQVENACSFIPENSMDENRAGLSRRFVGSANRTFEFEKRGQLFIGTHPLFRRNLMEQRLRRAQRCGEVATLGSRANS
jgi:hypothetical protein